MESFSGMLAEKACSWRYKGRNAEKSISYSQGTLPGMGSRLANVEN